MSTQRALADPTAVDAWPGLAAALEEWRQRLVSLGVAAKSVALSAADPAWCVAFEAAAGDTDPGLEPAWAELRARVSPSHPLDALALGAGPGADRLLALAIRLPPGDGVVGIRIAPPWSAQQQQLVTLALGLLQLALTAATHQRNERAAQLLEILGHVGAQERARGAAQEWVNRTAAWARAEAPAWDGALTVALFEMRGRRPHWWVAADTAWAEDASPEVREATEMAHWAALQAEEVSRGPWWAMPLLRAGEPSSVLVAHATAPGAGPWPPAALSALRSSAALAEPLLREWRRADRGLARHTWDSLRQAWRRIRGPGFLLWKAGAAAALAAAVLLLLVPVADRVTAPTVIEGATRHLVTAPFEGFIASVAVRPGDRVEATQLLARLDDRDALLEQARYRSEREQATARLREAMAERDAAKVALAGAELRQVQAQLALAEARLERVELRAPLAGLVVSGDWLQQVGGPVEAGKEMFEIATTDGFRVVLHVADLDIGRVQLGQPGRLLLAGQPQQSHAFRVVRLAANAAVREGQNGFRVEAEWVGPVPTLTPGMQGVAKIEVGQTNLLTAWTRPTRQWLRMKWWSWWW